MLEMILTRRADRCRPGGPARPGQPGGRPRSAPLPEALVLAGLIARNAPLSVRASRRLVVEAATHGDEARLRRLIDAEWEGLFASEDYLEGPRAFAEKLGRRSGRAPVTGPPQAFGPWPATSAKWRRSTLPFGSRWRLATWITDRGALYRATRALTKAISSLSDGDSRGTGLDDDADGPGRTSGRGCRRNLDVIDGGMFLEDFFDLLRGRSSRAAAVDARRSPDRAARWHRCRPRADVVARHRVALPLDGRKDALAAFGIAVISQWDRRADGDPADRPHRASG